MKKILLLSAFLIFACSSDDDSKDSNSNETFLERYDGVVWINDLYNPSFPENEEVDPVYYIFQNQDIYLDAAWYDSELECASMDTDWGTFFLSLSIIENLNNNLIIQENTGTTLSFTVSSDGQVLTESFNNSEEIQTFSRTNLSNPCD
tara:strand:+ start:464 stop:907 length:444 start_codon:yes stop_codon:yes gene_type:complete